MYITNFTPLISSHLNHAWEWIKKTQTKQKVAHYWQQKAENFNQSEFWQQYGKPFYKCNIQPLNRTDYFLLGGSLCAAWLTTQIAIKVFTVAAFPLALGLGTLLVTGAYSFSRYRLRKHFDDIAWNHLEEIRQTIAHVNTDKNQQIKRITQHYNLLQQPEFVHLDSDLKQLNEEMRHFRKIALSPSYEDQKIIVQSHLNYLEALVKGEVGDENLIKTLKTEIGKVGQKDQNMESLELHKQKLHDLKVKGARDHIEELERQINDLVQAAQRPTFKNAQQQLLQYIESLQNKLAPDRPINPLI